MLGGHQLRPRTPQHYDKGGQDVHIVPDVVVFQFLAPNHLHSVARQIVGHVAILGDDVALQHLVPEPGSQGADDVAAFHQERHFQPIQS